MKTHTNRISKIYQSDIPALDAFESDRRMRIPIQNWMPGKFANDAGQTCVCGAQLSIASNAITLGYHQSGLIVRCQK